MNLFIGENNVLTVLKRFINRSQSWVIRIEMQPKSVPDLHKSTNNSPLLLKLNK